MNYLEITLGCSVIVLSGSTAWFLIESVCYKQKSKMMEQECDRIDGINKQLRSRLESIRQAFNGKDNE